MKEATGELNITVITVVAIAAVAALFAVFILPAIQDNITQSSKCNSAVACQEGVPEAGSKTCLYYPVNEETGVQGDPETIVCNSNTQE